MDYPLRKRYPTLEDLAEMKASGYAPDTLERARADYQRGLAALQICEEIRAAFMGVRLGDGIGLGQAQGIDDHEDAATCARYREEDEKENWENITSESLNGCYSSLSFFDAEGMRFHLPAYLVADLKGKYRIGMEFTLTHISDRSQFSLLDRGQRAAVRSYLLHLATDEESSYHHADIREILETYWKADP